MRSLLLIIIFTGYSYYSLAQRIFWSDVTQGDKEMAVKEAEAFFNVLSINLYDSLDQFLLDDHVDLGGEAILPSDEWIEQLKKLTEKKNYSNIKCYGYLFDEFLDNFYKNDIIKNSYRVFDNHSILIHAINENEGTREDALVVMRMDEESEKWKIYSLIFVGIPVDSPDAIQIDLDQFRKEELTDANLLFYLPNDYSAGEIEQNQINYSLIGETERDAVFQIMMDDNKAKIHFYTYKFVEHMNMQYNLSNLVVTYIPIGIKFDYEVIDPFGTKNKGITIGIPGISYNIIFQYYSFFDIYEKNKDKVDYTIYSLEFIN